MRLADLSQSFEEATVDKNDQEDLSKKMSRELQTANKFKEVKPRSQQTRSHYVLKKCSQKGWNCVQRSIHSSNLLRSVYELHGRTRTGLLKNFGGLLLPACRQSSKILKTRRTYYKRNCCTWIILGTCLTCWGLECFGCECAHRSGLFVAFSSHTNGKKGAFPIRVSATLMEKKLILPEKPCWQLLGNVV